MKAFLGRKWWLLGPFLALTCSVLLAVGSFLCSDRLFFAAFALAAMSLVGGFLVDDLRSFGLAFLALLVWLYIFPQHLRIEEAKTRKETEQRYEKVAMALLAFSDHDPDRGLPTPAIVDKAGKPLLSWRVRILPYLGHEELFSRFKTDEPWDSRHNSSLLEFMPEAYAPREPADPSSFETHCQIFVGPNTAFGCPTGCRIITDFPKGLAGTILIAEGAVPVPWTKPEDITCFPGQSPPALGQKRATCMFSKDWKTFCVAWGNGEVQSLLVNDPANATLVSNGIAAR